MSEKIKILYVDDEEQNLVSFRANFRKVYDVYTAISADEAFALLKDIHIPIIISDQRMPQMTGVEFLEQTVKLYPDCIRLLITGQADIEVVIEAINRGQISKYIQKPWDWDKLSIAIDNCVTLYTSGIELKLKNEELQKINEELNKFVYSVSHDLRSPLTSILGVINLTKLMPELKVAESYFEMIEGRVLKLDSFIKKIIDYYKNSRAQEQLVEINFESLVLSIWNALNISSPIHFEVTSNQAVSFMGDVFRLNIIFENLISNAIKFHNNESKSSNIDVKIDVNEQRAKIIVSDNGIGINELYINDIFNLFFRTEESIKTEGSGIGLYIVKEAIDKLGGEIEVHSQVGQGTHFVILLPNKLL
jgi:two-component system sensor histidine kinase/response regulator